MQDMTTMVVEREIQSGAVSVPLRRRFMGVVAHTLAMVSPGLPRPKICSCGYPMDLRGDLLSEEDPEMLVDGVRFSLTLVAWISLFILLPSSLEMQYLKSQSEMSVLGCLASHSAC